jgi:hypothetical protein
MNRSLLVAYSDIMSAPSCANPFMKIAQTMHRYSSLVQLWRVNDRNILENCLTNIIHIQHELPRAPKNSTTTRATVVTLGRHGKVLKGGLVGGRNILMYLFTNWKTLYGNMWAVPPFLSRAPPSIGSGITTSIYCGASLETAMRWGIVPETSLFPAEATCPPPSIPHQPFALLVRGRGKSEFLEMPMYDPVVDEEVGQNKASAFVVNEDIWSLSYPGELSLEVVIKAEHEVPLSVTHIREMFVVEIEECLRYLTTSPDWIARTVHVPISSSASPRDKKVFSFSVQRLLDDDNYSASFRKRAMKVGIAYVEGAVAMTDTSGNEAGGKDGGAVDFSGLMTLLRAVYSKSERGDDGAKEGLDDGEEDRGYIDGQVDDDPTMQDLPRVASYHAASTKVRKGLRMKNKVYVPIKLRFSLLARIRGMDVPSAAAEKATDTFTPFLSEEKKKLTIGKSETVARLLASTVWLSPDAERGIWGCAMKAESVRRCFAHEASRFTQESGRCFESRDIVTAYEMAGAAAIVGADFDGENASFGAPRVSALIDNTIDAVPAMVRMSHSLAGRMKRALECIRMVRWMFQGKKEFSGALNHMVLAQTIVRHICLAVRMIVMAPQSVRLRSGCVLLLRKISALEKLLNLGRLDLRNGHRYTNPTGKNNRSTTDYSLPVGLPAPFVTNTSGSSTAAEVNAEAEFRKSMASPAVVVDKVPQKILQEIENICVYLYESLAHDVFQNFRADVKALVLLPAGGDLQASALAHSKAGETDDISLSAVSSSIGKDVTS